MERRLHDFIPELKDYYTVTSNGNFTVITLER